MKEPMFFEVAFEKMIEGEKIQSEFWESGDYIHIEEGIILNDGGNNHINLLTQDELRNTWFIYTDHEKEEA